MSWCFTALDFGVATHRNTVGFYEAPIAAGENVLHYRLPWKDFVFEEDGTRPLASITEPPYAIAICYDVRTGILDRQRGKGRRRRSKL